MSKIHDYTSRVDILNTDPLIATFTFATDYSESVVRISFDAEIGKYWVQHKVNRFHRALVPSDIYASVSVIDVKRIAASIHDEVSRNFADRLGSHGFVVESLRNDFVVYAENESALMTRDELRKFALRIIREFDTRYVPSLEEIEREVVAGLKEIAAVAERVGEMA